MAMPLRPMPVGFEAEASMTQVYLMQKYHCNQDQIKRWRAELGIKSGNKKRICQYTLDGEFVQAFPSLHDAGRALGLHWENISGCANGRLPKAYGFLWKYEEEEVENRLP